ncbi:MAG: baseplate J/gp47 family protein [Elusimicrobiota bacterium]
MTEELKVPQVDYSSRDYESIISDLIAKIPFYVEEWTDFNPSDLGIVLLELFSYTADGLHYYVDRMLNEAFLPTAVQRQSVINLLKLIGYTMFSAVPASVNLEFNLGEVKPRDILIPKGTRIQTAGGSPLIFETTDDLIIPAGELTGEITAIEGETKQEDVGISNGDMNQKFSLEGVPIIDGTLKIFIDEGAGDVLWNEAKYFVDVGPNEQKYCTTRDAEDKITIMFGDGINGRIPKNGAKINAEYRIGGGKRGNVGANTITQVLDTIMLEGVPITIDVTNPLASSGGADKETIEHAKKYSPLQLRGQNRAVSLSDYIWLAEGYPGVLKATVRALVYKVWVTIVPEGGGYPSEVLKTGLLEYLNERKTITTQVYIEDPKYVEIDLSADIVCKGNFKKADVENNVYEAVNNFFAIENVDFEQRINISDMYALLDGTEGVDYLTMKKLMMHPLVYIGRQSATAEFKDITVKENIKTEEWTINMISRTQFTVEGTVSGLQTNTGTIGTKYTTDNGELEFILSVLVGELSVDDWWIIRVSQWLGNVMIKQNELPAKGIVQFNITGGI